MEEFSGPISKNVPELILNVCTSLLFGAILNFGIDWCTVGTRLNWTTGSY